MVTTFSPPYTINYVFLFLSRRNYIKSAQLLNNFLISQRNHLILKYFCFINYKRNNCFLEICKYKYKSQIKLTEIKSISDKISDDVIGSQKTVIAVVWPNLNVQIS